MSLIESGTHPESHHALATRLAGRTVTHSHHYNVALVRSVLGTERIDARSILETAAAELVFQTLRERAASERWRGEGRWLAEAASLFLASGLGGLDLAGVTEAGGEARVTDSHFTAGWKKKYGKSKHAVCAVTAGYLSGALAAAFGHPFEVTEVSCAAQDKPECRFRVKPAGGEVPFSEVPAALRQESLSLPAPTPPSFDEQAVVRALLDALPGGDPEGRIPAFGGAVTRLWADYYNRVSHRFEREIPRVMGNKFANLPSLVLTEAGHTCAFHTFGEIMRSDEWWERVVPLLRSREDWLHAALAVVNTLGWGEWRIHTLVPGERATLRVYDGYEATGHRSTGLAEAPRCYFARGTFAALMNLVFVGDVAQRPELTQSYYNQLFRSPLSFRAVETRCRAVADPYCELIANPLTTRLLNRND